jgi:hypothetical protein
MKLIDPTLFYIVKAELQQTLWRISLDEIKLAAKLGKSIYVVDIYQNFVSSTYPLFEIEKYLTIEDVDVVYLRYEQEDVVVLPTIICNLLFKFHSGWVNLMYNYFLSEDFIILIQTIKDIRNNSNECFPIITDMFNCFVVNPTKLKGAIISEYSYRNKFNSGYALATFEKEKPPTLKAIENSIKPKKSFNWYLQNDMLDSVSQGCFLFNVELISEYSNNKFTEEVCKILKHLNICTLLLGTGLFKLSNLLGEKVLMSPHPLEILKDKKEYNTDIFIKFEEMSKINF